MSYADQVFIGMCRDIIENGCSTEGEKVRPHWEDGTLAYTIKRFGVVNRYDLSKEFPALTLRRNGSQKRFSTRFSGSGRKNPTTSMNSTAISGTSGRMKTVPSARPTAISWE